MARALAGDGGQVILHLAPPTTLFAPEFSHMAGYTDEKARAKMGIVDPQVTPRVVILDPALTAYTPTWLWSASGIRALDPVVETLYSPGVHPVNDVLALEATGELFAYVRRTKETADDLETKYRCQLAAWMSFSGPASVKYGHRHRPGRIVGETFGVAHGITSVITFPHVMRYKAEPEAPRLAPMAYRLKLVSDDVTAYQATLSAADEVADQLSEDPDAVLRIARAAW